jgi:hypothetical protein
MFQLLSRVLLWMLIGVVAYSLFQKFYPAGTFVGRLLLGIVLVILALAFFSPSEPVVASLWRFLSFPLKPLGASALMLIVAAQKIKGGGIEKPGGYLLGWALTILLLSSTPAIAYFLIRPSLAMIPPTSSTLVALGSTTTNSNISDVAVRGILPMGEMKTPTYLLQNPQDIRTRGLRVEDFVPSAETLQLTTHAWELYLQQVYVFLSGHR